MTTVSACLRVPARVNDDHGDGGHQKHMGILRKEEEAEGHNGLAIGSIRRVAEARAIHDEGGLVIWVDSDQHTRYARLQAANRGRHEDMLPFEEWAQQEDIEMNPQSDDPRILNMAGVRAIADITIDNNFDSFEAYQEYLIKEFEL